MNVWRYVEQLSNGDRIYQCLKCKHKFQSTFKPGYWDWDDEIKKEKYCPVVNYCSNCGTKWDNPLWKNRNDEYGNPTMLGERRLKLYHFKLENFFNRPKRTTLPTWEICRVHFVIHEGVPYSVDNVIAIIYGSAHQAYNFCHTEYFKNNSNTKIKARLKNEK